MPRKPKRPCSFPGCPALTEDQHCPEHQCVMDARYNKYERDPKTKKRYGRMWPRIRAAQLTAHPLCAMCAQQQRAIPASEVHHILPLAKGGTHDPDNLMSLCKPCHSRITLAEGGRWRSR